MAQLRPGKGAHLDLTEEMLDFIHTAIEDLWNACGEPNSDESLNALIDADQGMQYLKDINATATHWKKAQDNFGTKLYKALPWGEGEMRITVVLNNAGSLKLDIRFWYPADQ